MKNLFSAMLRRSEQRRTYAELLQLDDHLLNDIGITRADLNRMSNARRIGSNRVFWPHA